MDLWSTIKTRVYLFNNNKFSVNLGEGGGTEPLEGETHPAGLYADKSLIGLLLVLAVSYSMQGGRLPQSK